MMIDLMAPAIQSQASIHRVEKAAETEESRPVEGAEETRQSPLDLAHGRIPRLPKVVEWKKEHFSGEDRYDAKGRLVERARGEDLPTSVPGLIDLTV